MRYSGKKYIIRKFRYSCLFLFVFFPQLLISQNIGEKSIEDILEDILMDIPDEIDLSEYQEKLLLWYRNPLDLNLVSREELSELLFLSPVQTDDILNYRRRYLGFKSIYELVSIPSIDRKSLGYLILFTRVGTGKYNNIKALDVFKKGSNQLLVKYERTLEKQKGYQISSQDEYAYTQSYSGNPDKYYLRFVRNISDKTSIGLCAEKDPGEEFFTGNQKQGFDFYSAHYYYSGKGKIQNLALGDYYAKFGQGLVFHSGFSMGKSSNVLNIFKAGREIGPYRSANESNFLRGAALTLGLGKSNISFFYSSKKLDAGINNDTLYEEDYFSSFLINGYHRTQSEYDKKNNIQEQIAGIRFNQNFESLKIGLTGIAVSYNKKMLSDPKPYKRYSFSGNQFQNIGADYSLSQGPFHLFGEIAFDGNNCALLQGSIINLNSRIHTGILFRYYPADYIAPYANAFRSNTHTQNEEGLYYGINYKASSKWVIAAYCDMFRFPWLKYNVDAPSRGHEYLLDLRYYPSYSSHISLKIKYYQKEKNLSDNESVMNQIIPYERINTRLEFEKKSSRYLTLRSRIEISGYKVKNQTSSQGFLSFQDIIYDFPNTKLKIYGRIAYFNSENYDSRLYAYENDLLYSFYIPAFHDEGFRKYLLLRYQPNSMYSFWIKIARTTYLNKDIIGSGGNEIEGNKKTEFRFLVRLDF